VPDVFEHTRDHGYELIDGLELMERGFKGAPNAYDLARAKAAILGVPFDCRTHPVRVGARLDPGAIREQSALVRPYQPPLWNFNPLERLGMADRRNSIHIGARYDLQLSRRHAGIIQTLTNHGASPTMASGGAAMHVSLTPRLEELVRRKVESGLYNNASEVVREALRLMAAHEDLYAIKVRALRAALDEGEASPIAKGFSFARINAELDAKPRRPRA
jgi:putative addiction module CopG family antidote